jgi:hypothetical protein
MFNGHLDINSLMLCGTRDPWTPIVEGRRLYGHGVQNMKGGVAAMVAAAEAVLLGRPGGGGMLGDVEVEDTPPMVGEDDQNEEDPQSSGRNREEFDRDEVPDMVGEERSPGLRGGCAPLRH